MKKLVAVSIIALLSLSSVSAHAGAFKDTRAKISDVRMSMIDLLMHKEKRDAQNWKVADGKSDDAMSALNSLKAPAGKESTFKEFKSLVKDFLNTRDKELRKALVKGDDAEAKRILTVVQKERFGKITTLAEELDK